MKNPNSIKLTDIPVQTVFYGDVNIKNNEDISSTIPNKYSTYDKEKELRPAKGIIIALIFCIPFWLLFIKFALQLF